MSVIILFTDVGVTELQAVKLKQQSAIMDHQCPTANTTQTKQCTGDTTVVREERPERTISVCGSVAELGMWKPKARSVTHNVDDGKRCHECSVAKLSCYNSAVCKFFKK